jgi:hypothetical protein
MNFIKNFDTAPLAATSAYGDGTVISGSGITRTINRTSAARSSSKHPWQGPSFGSQEMMILRKHEFTVGYHDAGDAEGCPVPRTYSAKF